MSKVKSIFGAYADNLQVVIDQAQNQFAPTWFEQYFDWAPPQTSLTFVTAIGRARIEAAASIVNRDSQSPLRSRSAFEKLNGEIPAIKEKMKMSESDYRDFFTLQQMNVADTVKRQQLLDFMFGDVKTVGNSAMKRLDIMVLEGISTGQISLSITNNPDGLTLASPVDLFMPAGNKTTAATGWNTPATATPLSDISTVVDYAQTRGQAFGKILMSRSQWLRMNKTTEVKELLSNFYRLPQNKVQPTLSGVNEYLQEHQFPTIELVDVAVGIESDGVIGTLRPFNEHSVVFVPNGKLGRIHNAIALEELRPVENVTYSKFKQALISKWSENEPFGEYTKVELNAFPALEAIDGIHILTASS